MKKSDGAGMKIQFIGTGAADFDWSEYGKPGVLGSTSTLLDDHVLIDCGPTVPAALARFNADAAEITDIVITHNHSDHFDMESVKKIAGNGKSACSVLRRCVPRQKSAVRCIRFHTDAVFRSPDLISWHCRQIMRWRILMKILFCM